MAYFSANGNTSGGEFNLTGAKTRYRVLDDTRDRKWSGYTKGMLWVDRFNVRLMLDDADFTIGRQAITFGKAYFWNPLDVYLPFDPNQFDRDYKPGVDAVRVDVPIGDFSGFTLAGVLGRTLDSEGNYQPEGRTWDASWYGSSILTRYYTNYSEWDFSLQAGKVYGGYQLGGGLVGELKTLEIRGEMAYFRAADSPPLPTPFHGDLMEDNFTGVIGIGRRFDNSLVVESEFLYNGGGENSNFDLALLRMQNGNILHLGRYLAGCTVSYDITPLIIGRLTSIYSFSDSSFQCQPSLVLSISDNSELLLGAGVNQGEGPADNSQNEKTIMSEFGSYPDYYFAEFKIYF
jgi:hypothetical protein